MIVLMGLHHKEITALDLFQWNTNAARESNLFFFLVLIYESEEEYFEVIPKGKINLISQDITYLIIWMEPSMPIVHRKISIAKKPEGSLKNRTN